MSKVNCHCGHSEWCSVCSPNADYPVRVSAYRVREISEFLKNLTPDYLPHILSEKAYEFGAYLEKLL